MENQHSVLTSSPDPLGMSTEDMSTTSPTKTPRPNITPRRALSNASGNARVQEFYINTPPSRKSSPIKNPGKDDDDGESPWRIRLTVQAERVDEHHMAVRKEADDMLRLTERTTTTTIPLKGGDDSPSAAPKRGRGRPRKSLDSPKNGTPKPKAVRRRKTLPHPSDAVDQSKAMARSPSSKKGGRGPKKTMQGAGEAGQAKIADESVPVPEQVVDGRVRDKSSRSRSRARRMEITPMKKGRDFDIANDQSDNGIILEHFSAPTSSFSAIGGLNRGRLGSDMNNDQMTSTLERSTLDIQDEAMWRNMICYGTRSPSPDVAKLSQISGREVDPDKSTDPTEEHQEFDSILEGEGFSMVSVSSLPSAEYHSASPRDQDGGIHTHRGASREITPITSSPPLPRAPVRGQPQTSPRHIDEPTSGTPKLTRIVRTGAALRDALNPGERGKLFHSLDQQSQQLSSPAENPKNTSKEPSPSQGGLPMETSERLFSGFGAGTRRELKAGLRLGEELAKRQRIVSPVGNSPDRKDKQRSEQRSGLDNSPVYPQLPRSEEKRTSMSLEPDRLKYPSLSNHQLPSPDRSVADEDMDGMSWRAPTPIGLKQTLPILQTVAETDMQGPDTSAIEPTMMAREIRWQQEREAVSRQIQMANSSKVIVINSDDESSYGPLAKKHNISTDLVHPTDPSQLESDESSLVLTQPEITKSRRSKIPSPWRRNGEASFSDEPGSTNSDLFWQPNQAHTDAAKKRQKRRELSKQTSISTTDCSIDSKTSCSEDTSEDLIASLSKKVKTTTSKTESYLPTPSESEAEHVEEPSSTDTTGELIQPTEELMIKDNSSYTKDNIQPTNELLTEGTTTETLADETSISFLLSTSSHEPTPIDPLLLQKEPLQKDKSSARAVPQQPPPQPTSWLSVLTGPISRLFVTKPSLPPATKSDILCSSPHRPLPLKAPWQDCHYLALAPLYYASMLYGSHIFPYNPHSRSAQYCGEIMVTSLGWKRKVNKSDCGITDAFMILLKERGYMPSKNGGQLIDEEFVVGMCVDLWADLIMTGEAKANYWAGEVIGMRWQGDRRWTEKDIEWERNTAEYFARKQRDFDGLPSWKEKGLV